jgi:hypothetical protein
VLIVRPQDDVRRHSAFGIRHSAFGIRHSAFGIRHPGGPFPDVEGLPRSTVIAVWRDAGALVG